MGKAEDILSVLRGELRSGKYSADDRFPSEYSLMSRFDASRVTINKVTSQLVSEGFIKRGARGAGTKVLHTSPFPVGHIAYIGPVAHAYCGRLMNGIQQVAFLKNYAVSFFCPDKELYAYLEKIRNSQFDGVLASTIGKIPQPFPFPVVYLDDAYPVDGIIKSSVTCTNYIGAYKMAEEVIARGHREIVVCANDFGSSVSRMDRVRGFRDAMLQHNIPDTDKRIFHEEPLVAQSGTASVRSILRKFPDTTVIMTDSDDIAYVFYYALQDMKLPQQITVTGYGNIMHRHNFSRIASVEQHPEDIGAQGVTELIRCLEDKNYVAEKVIEIETSLVHLEKIPYIKQQKG